MQIFINGEKKSTAARTVTELVAELGLPPQTLMVEHNGSALLRSEWAEKSLAEDHRIEILRVAAGG